MNGDGGGGGGGGGKSKLATALIIVLVVSLFLFFAQLFYVLWRRRIFRRQTYEAGGGGSHGDEGSRYSPSVSNFTTVSSSKELLYFLSFRSPDFSLDANSATATTTAYSNSVASDLNSDRQSDFEAIDVDLLKLYGIFGPPKILFTIKEDQEKQPVELPVGKSVCPSEIEAKKEEEKDADQNEIGACSANSAAVEAEAAEKDEIENGGSVDDISAFSTPCGSPLYLTPTASPVHERSDCRSGSEDTFTST